MTSNNKIEFIHLLCHYHLNLQMERQFQSFRKGVNSVIPLLWLTLFNEQELQTLISGTQSSIDLDDLYKHTHYSGMWAESVVLTIYGIAFCFMYMYMYAHVLHMFFTCTAHVLQVLILLIMKPLNYFGRFCKTLMKNKNKICSNL